jgi:Uma2 family endonuclease
MWGASKGRSRASDAIGSRSMMDQPGPVGIVWRVALRREFPAEQIMSMPAVRRRWTIEEVEQLVDAREGLTPRYELVDGELLVTPAPTPHHQRLVFALALRLQRYLTANGVGEVLLGPCELKLASGERYEPDLFVVPADAGRRTVLHAAVMLPILIVESLSPGSSRHDRITKRRTFQRNDVPDYWIIDGDAEAFDAWRPADERPALIDDHLVWLPSGASEPFGLDVREFFASTKDAGPLP